MASILNKDERRRKPHEKLMMLTAVIKKWFRVYFYQTFSNPDSSVTLQKIKKYIELYEKRRLDITIKKYQ